MNDQPTPAGEQRRSHRFRRAVAAVAAMATAGALVLVPATPAAAASPAAMAAPVRSVAAPVSVFDLQFLMSALQVVLQQAQLRQQQIDKAAADKLAAAKKAADDKAAADKKAAQDKADEEKAAKEAKEKAAKDKADKEKAAKEKEAKDKAAKEKAAKDKAAKEKAAKDKAAKDKAKKKVWTFKAIEALNGRTAKRATAKWAKVYAKGSTLHITCQAYGAYAYGSPIWDRTTDGLWVTDHYVLNNTHNKFVKGMPRCDKDPKPKNAPLPVRLNSTQIANAKLIIAVGKGYHIPERGWKVAIATAMQESRLLNLSGGDRDSVGMFQQRPSTGWGSVRQCTTKVLAIRAFYGVATHTHNPGLTDIRGWQKMSITRAAQAVQRSGFPNAYAKWEKLADALVTNYGDQVSAKR